MSDIALGNTGAGRVRAGFDFDHAALETWLKAHVTHYAGPLEVEQFRGGQSNPTYRLTTPQRCYVLRRKPPGALIKGAHAVEREARVQAALHAQGFPVAPIHALCEDAGVIGTPFYVMDMVEGRIFWDAEIPGACREERGAIYDAMNATLARLHGYDPAAIGLGDYGHSGNYFARQLARWSRQYREDEAAGRDTAMDAAIAWLEANLPPDDGTVRVLHGDFRIDNLIFHPTRPEVLAVLDWELSTLGHPLSDFAYHAMMYHVPAHIVAGLGGADCAALGIPGEADYLAAYCRRTGRARADDYRYCMAFNLFRLAAIFHGIRGRVIRGTAANAQARERAEAFGELAQLALRATRGF
ncbi:phosphotransferase [Novosphingobium profundi]|uniref:phosphotransferase n=1 Tax=Novosphingobium profundi TaxID=1774954 RepID=UPI001BD91E9C|nr:phosphotransferase [Novosphingobium profundi]MBT0669537.1 phosphotransferase [Novosphingobium profundi]